MKTLIKITGIFFLLAVTTSCTTLRPYERIYVDDASMNIGISSDEIFEYYVESIREGGITPGSGKSGGGCGCN